MMTMTGECWAKPLGNPDAAAITGCAGVRGCTSPDAPSSQRASKTTAVISVSKTGRWDGKDEDEALLRASQLDREGLGLELGLASSREPSRPGEGPIRTEGCCPSTAQPWNKSESQV